MSRPAAAPAARRTQAERRASTERSVLEATAALIAEGGVRAVTLAAVGERAGYSRGIVNHQFGSRDALLRLLAGHLQDSFVPPDPAGLDGRDGLLAFVDGYLAHFEAEPRDATAFLVMWVESLSSEPGLRVVFQARDERFRLTVLDFLRAGTADGSIDAELDIDAMAMVIVGLLRGTGLQALASSRQKSFEPVQRQVHTLVAKVLTPSPPSGDA